MADDEAGLWVAWRRPNMMMTVMVALMMPSIQAPDRMRMRESIRSSADDVHAAACAGACCGARFTAMIGHHRISAP